MKAYIQLIRPKDWAKNLFLFVPLFFSGEFFNTEKLLQLAVGFVCFSLVASCIYIMNDYRDIDDDKKHPIKKFRPLASGAVNKSTAVIIAILFLIIGFGAAWFLRDKFMFILGIYFLLNVGYSFGLKNIPILDIFIIAIGFVLRIKGGSVISLIPLSEWIVIMVFLLALFLAFAKRRDDVLLKLSSGDDMRKSVKGYNLEFINNAISLICAVIIVAYFMYTMAPETKERLQTYRLYYTCLFVMAGIFRYLQLVFVQQNSQSPTKILYKDRFIQVTILLWVLSFYVILYAKDITLFQ
ncbi:MAG TPA: decaprenyl-phosphate phosphoribosyltransferase [Ferruginibacter sp.]|nr:decaprenyl-phosphate phosphoribosyltransferase [Ferruginibacter sp.]HRE63032.1 decaprenyl-phosphate phosphoribosyltransferase [Ferruginibacter sp.]